MGMWEVLAVLRKYKGNWITSELISDEVKMRKVGVCHSLNSLKKHYPIDIKKTWVRNRNGRKVLQTLYTIT